MVSPHVASAHIAGLCRDSSLQHEKPAPLSRNPSHLPEPPSAELLSAQERFKDAIDAHYSSIQTAFRALDKDGSGKVSAAELAAQMRNWNQVRAPRAQFGAILGAQFGAQFSDPSRLLHSQEAQSADIFGRSHTERNAVEDPILSFPDPNHVGNAHLHINRHPEMR